MPRNIKIFSGGGCNEEFGQHYFTENLTGGLLGVHQGSWIIQGMLKTVELDIYGDKSSEEALTNHTSLSSLAFPVKLHPHTEC